jgi:hypothetical protein
VPRVGHAGKSLARSFSGVSLRVPKSTDAYQVAPSILWFMANSFCLRNIELTDRLRQLCSRGRWSQSIVVLAMVAAASALKLGVVSNDVRSAIRVTNDVARSEISKVVRDAIA